MSLPSKLYINSITLRPYVESDRNRLSELLMDKKIGQYMGDGALETLDEAHQLFDKILEIYETENLSKHFEVWGIEIDHKLVGHFELKETQNTQIDELEIVYFLDPAYWNKGYMTTIIIKIKEYSIQYDKQIIATINPENKTTLRVLEKIGIENQNWILEGEDRTYKVWLKR